MRKRAPKALQQMGTRLLCDMPENPMTRPKRPCSVYWAEGPDSTRKTPVKGHISTSQTKKKQRKAKTHIKQIYYKHKENKYIYIYIYVYMYIYIYIYII